MVTMPIASRALIRPGPRTETMAIASSREGKASSTSITRMMTLSDPAAQVAGQRAQRRPDDDGEPDGREADDQREARAEEHPAELVAHVAVHAQDMLRLFRRAPEQMDARARSLLDAFLEADQHLIRRKRGDERGQDGGGDQDAQESPCRRPPSAAGAGVGTSCATGWSVRPPALRRPAAALPPPRGRWPSCLCPHCSRTRGSSSV